ncbi:MAG: ATP-binding cassette domain-containing protein, partial [Phycisphaerae bacterium]|nr:ATP-binding cassette domain-containing protein [Phycisphaerae bacterium]
MNNAATSKSNSKYILAAENLHKSFGKGSGRNHVLHGIDLRVRCGEFLAIMGPSGCGKSTLLHLLGLMSLPDEGSVRIDGREVSRGNRERTAIRRRQIGFVFQRFNLLGQLSGEENVRISLKVRGLRDDGQVAELLETMGVAADAHRKPSQMSIGQQQRVAVVRALAHSPAILFADEPTG